MNELSDDQRRVIRALAREDLSWFNRLIFWSRRKYAWQRASHHEAVTNALQAVFEGKIRRLIINIPPRYSKTELVKAFIAWATGKAPDSEWIYTSYSSRLAAASSFDVRVTLGDPEYKATFPEVQLRDDSQARDEWRTTAGGLVYATGSGGTITGYGAGKVRDGFGGAFIIDDPHKADEVRSDVMRANVIEWYQNTVQSRVNSPDTPIILIMQRLHEQDLAGWLLGGGSGEEWAHICMPAIQADGSPLWPEKHGIEDLRRMETAMPYTFAGQYMQRPAPA
ncbi:MAG: terminase, partial [Burkholderiales bacterium 21-58-4]